MSVAHPMSPTTPMRGRSIKLVPYYKRSTRGSCSCSLASRSEVAHRIFSVKRSACGSSRCRSRARNSSRTELGNRSKRSSRRSRSRRALGRRSSQASPRLDAGRSFTRRRSRSRSVLRRRSLNMTQRRELARGVPSSVKVGVEDKSLPWSKKGSVAGADPILVLQEVRAFASLFIPCSQAAS